MNNENQNTEYKRIWKDEYLKWVCGFANAQGGKIYIGIDDDLSVIGVTHLQKQLEDIPNKIVSVLGIVPKVCHIERDNKDIIEISIEHSNVPVSYKGIFYIRSGATNQELRGLALQHFLMKRFGKSWEDTPCYGATIDEIDPKAITYFLRKGIKVGRISSDAEDASPEDVIKNLGLLEDGVPCNGAILLFGKHPQQRYVTSSFKIGRFGSTNFDLLSQEIVDGSLIQMPEKVMQILSDKYLVRPIHYNGLQRIETLEIPEKALREIICNSIVHRDYQGTWTQMSIYSSHIRLWNEGTLPEGLSIEKLISKHTSMPRNPKIAEAFYRAGFIEAWGRGIEKTINDFKADRLTPPTFSVEQGGIVVNIPREKFTAINISGATDIRPKNTDVNESKPNQNRYKPIQTDTKLSQKEAIIKMLKENPNISMDEISRNLSITKSSVQRRIQLLVKENRVRHVGSTNGGYWDITD